MFPYLIAGGLRTFILMDDGVYVFENPDVLKGISWSGARWAFSTFHMSNWHPLTWLSHMLDASLFGQAAWGHHLTSVLLHGLNTGLLFLALTRLTGAPWPSGFAAALFGVHPLRVESVAWVAERKDVLSGLFFMLLLLAYERYVRRREAARYLLVPLLLTLGLMSKPMLVTAPFVLLLLDFWPLGRARRRPRARRSAPTPPRSTAVSACSSTSSGETPRGRSTSRQPGDCSGSEPAASRALPKCFTVAAASRAISPCRCAIISRHEVPAGNDNGTRR